MTDPMRSWYGHPILPAGWNADDINGDECNGAGTNWQIWPVLFDTFEGLEVLIITEELANVFNTTCADYIVPGENNVMVPLAQDYVAAVRNVWGPLMVAGQDNLILFPYERREVKVRPEPDTALVANTDEVHQVRRKA